MKALLPLFVAIAGLTANVAAAKTIAQYQVVVEDAYDSETGADKVIVANVLVDDSSRVEVEVNEYDNRFVFVPVDTYTLHNRLPGKTFESVLGHLRNLANAELKKTYSDIVCMIMPGVGMYSVRGILIKPPFNTLSSAMTSG